MHSRKPKRQNLLRSLFSLTVTGSLVASSLFVPNANADQAGVFNPFRAESSVEQSAEYPRVLENVPTIAETQSGKTEPGFWDGSATDALVVETIATQDESSFSQSPLRESTGSANGLFLPPTTGWFVESGERWIFVPANPNAVTIVRAIDKANQTPENKFRTISAIENLRSSAVNAVELVPSNPLRNRNQPTERFALSLLENHSPTVTELLTVKKLIVTDNLVFRRAMHQVRAHEGDLQWTVSGEVSNFNNESRLDIRTAKLSN